MCHDRPSLAGVPGAFAGSPQTTAVAPRLFLGVAQLFLTGEVRWIAALDGEAFPDECSVEKVVAPEDVREKTAESIAALDVELQADGASLKAARCERSGLSPEALGRLVRMGDLGRIHADQPHPLRPSIEEHTDRVTVDNLRNDGLSSIRGSNGSGGLRPCTAEQAQDDGQRRGRGDSLHGGSLWHHDDTMIEFTDRAMEILRRSHQAARRFNPDAWIRVFRRADSVQFALAEGPEKDDRVIENEDFRVAVEDGLEGIVAVREPHDQLFLRPSGSSPVPGEVIDATGH